MAFLYHMENVFEIKHFSAHHLRCRLLQDLRRYLKQKSNSKEQGPNKAKHKK